jgi:hypothetical protein
MQAVRAAVVQYGQAVDVLAYGVPSAANLSQLATAAAGLEAQGERARADLPPACLPGLRDSYAASLGDFIRAAQGAKDSAQALQNGDVQQADSDAQASTSALEAGLQAMRKAANYLSGPEASQ